ncbi:hypothetical protein LCGC14_0629810 [marine sediment metagenome]|uniref:Uncharacterized protein n=1 Tax=marine sediment metagenome TaxID=412755 RepID=A0A0F9R265_9ZZZZ
MKSQKDCPRCDQPLTPTDFNDGGKSKVYACDNCGFTVTINDMFVDDEPGS